MEDRVQILFRIQPVLQIPAIRKMYQQEQKMQEHNSQEEEDSAGEFSKMFAAERRKIARQQTKKALISGNYGRDAREITGYVSSLDFKR